MSEYCTCCPTCTKYIGTEALIKDFTVTDYGISYMAEKLCDKCGTRVYIYDTYGQVDVEVDVGAGFPDQEEIEEKPEPKQMYEIKRKHERNRVGGKKKKK